jgi:AraC-like DNA-binding protein
VNLASLAAASTAALGLLIASALALTQGRRAQANRILALGVMLACLYLLSLVPLHSPQLTQLSLLRLGGLSVFLFGPALYLYVRAMVQPPLTLHRGDLLHLLPTALLLADLAAPGIIPDVAQGPLRAHPELIGVLFYVLLIGYLTYSAALLRQYHRELPDRYASLEEVSYRWLNTLIVAALILAGIGLSFALIRWLFDGIQWSQQLWSISLMVSLNYLIAFFAITQPAVFNPQTEAQIEAHVATNETTAPRYETSSLTAGAASAIWEQLEQHMATHAPHLQPQLKIGELAQALDIPPNHLSQTLNQLGGCSFFNYVSRYRVAHAKVLLQQTEPGERTLLDIAMASGFNSESAFYKQFRQQQGMTPRQFQQSEPPKA